MGNHEKGCERIRQTLTKLNLPILPPHIVYSENYHPDISTRVSEKFVIIDFINTEKQFNFDIGGLTTLLLHKDIVDSAVAVVAEGVFPDLVGKIQRFRSSFLERLVILRESEFEGWLEGRVEKSDLWKPEDLKIQRTKM